MYLPYTVLCSCIFYVVFCESIVYAIICRRNNCLLKEVCCSKIFHSSVVIFQGDQGPVGRRGRNGGEGSVVSTRLRIRRASL